MKLDDRAATAAEDLLDRAARRPAPTLDDLLAPTRSAGRRRLVVGAAAALVVLAAFAFVLAAREDSSPPADAPRPVPVPTGIAPEEINLPVLGVRLQVPSTWEEVPPIAGFVHTWRGEARDAYVTATRIAAMPDTSIGRFVDARRAFLESAPMTCDDGEAATVDGHPAQLLRCTAPRSTVIADPIAFSEWDIDLGDDTFGIVVIGEPQPEHRTELRDWIASTVAVGEVPAIDGTPTHPDGVLAPPVGVTSKTIDESGLGFRADVPASWTAMSTPPPPLETAWRSTSAGGLDARSVDAAQAVRGAREASLRRAGAVITGTADTTIDGHAVHIIRWRMPRNRLFEADTSPGSDVFAILNTEYDLDLGDGTVTIIDIGNGGGASRELVDWIRSTISVVPRSG